MANKTLAERVNEEHEAAEAEEAEQAEADGDDNGGPTVPDAPEPEPQKPQPTEAQIGKAFDSAAKSAEKHVAKLAGMMGTDPSQVVPCPCCDFPGYVFLQRPPLDGERLEAVKAVIGEEDVRAYKRDGNAVECESCNGYGKLVRPTKVEDQRLAVCATCNGYGWHSPIQQPPSYTYTEQPPGTQTYYVPPPPTNGPPVYTPYTQG